MMEANPGHGHYAASRQFESSWNQGAMWYSHQAIHPAVAVPLNVVSGPGLGAGTEEVIDVYGLPRQSSSI